VDVGNHQKWIDTTYQGMLGRWEKFKTSQWNPKNWIG
jgi:hypothetical protein